jgi:hypothetical protein
MWRPSTQIGLSTEKPVTTNRSTHSKAGSEEPKNQKAFKALTRIGTPQTQKQREQPADFSQRRQTVTIPKTSFKDPSSEKGMVTIAVTRLDCCPTKFKTTTASRYTQHCGPFGFVAHSAHAICPFGLVQRYRSDITARLLPSLEPAATQTTQQARWHKKSLPRRCTQEDAAALGTVPVHDRGATGQHTPTSLKQSSKLK